MAQSISLLGATYNDVPAVELPKSTSGIAKFIDVTDTTATASDVSSGKYFYDANGTKTEGTNSGGGGSVSLQSKTATPTESQQLIEPDNGYDGLSDVTVNAISSSYVGSGVTRRSSSDLSASGSTVSVPSGYYEANSNKSISNGLATAPNSISGTSATVSTGTNTLTLSKTVSVTPSVTAGYISSGTAGNSNVSLTASVNTRSSSDLTVSGDTVTVPAGYYSSQATKSVASGTAGTPVATKGNVSNHSISVTPSVTNSAGYISAGTKTGTAVSVSASELVSGNLSLTDNTNSTDVTNYETVSVTIPFVTYYTSTSAPTSQQGNDGDIWLNTSGSSGGGDLTKLGTVTFLASLNLCLIGGVWKDENDNWIMCPEVAANYQSKQFDLYAPSGISYVDVSLHYSMNHSTYPGYTVDTSKATLSGNATTPGSGLAKYVIRITGDCTIDFYD